MVRKGDYEVEFFHPDTKLPFKEHVSKEGITYFEMEPDAEFFIRIFNHNPDLKRTYAALTVDGKKTQKRSIKCLEDEILGTLIYNYGTGFKEDTSLRARREINKRKDFNSSPLSTGTGSIIVEISHGITTVRAQPKCRYFKDGKNEIKF